MFKESKITNGKVLRLSTGPIQFEVLAKFSFARIARKNLEDECSLACAHKIFVNARMLGFSLKFPAV